MKRLIAVLALSFANPAFGSDAPSYESLMEAARASFETENWEAMAGALEEAQKQRPYSLHITRLRVLAYALLGDYDRAIALAAEIADRGLSLSFEGHPGFDALKQRPAFAPVARKMAANEAPAGDSRIVFEIDDDGLLPEAYAATQDGARAFIGSARTGKILGKTGKTFAQASGGVYALAIENGWLWAAANDAPPYAGASESRKAVLLKYALENGALLARFPASDENALIGAIAVTPGGLIASDSMTPRLLIRRPDRETLEIFAEDARFVNLQGLAYDRRRGKIFVADYLAGLFCVDPVSGDVSALANPGGAHLGGLDGLSYYRGDLIGVQNGVSPQRLVRIRLNNAGDAVDAVEALVKNHADWAEPTNGATVGDAFHYVATSNWPAYDRDGGVREDVVRAPVRIMSVDLAR